MLDKNILWQTIIGTFIITILTRQDLQPCNTTLHLPEFVWQLRMPFRPVIYDAKPDKSDPFSVKMGPKNLHTANQIN